MLIRPVQPDSDFERIVEIIKADQPDPITVGQFRAWYYNMPPGRICRRMVAVNDGGQVIGYSVATHQRQSPPGHFYVWVVVDPGQRGQGAGTALYSGALTFVKSEGATRLTSKVNDNCPVSLRFAQQRGFEVDGHSFRSALDLATFDDSPYSSVIDDLQAAGIRFASLADFGDSEPARRRLYDLNLASIKDIPGFEGAWMSFEEFEKTICGADWYRPDGQIIALDGDQWVGLAAAQLLPQERAAYNLMTGVLRPYRRRKIALALKVLVARYARDHGALCLRTTNDSDNIAMLAINERLGYRPQPGTYTLRLDTV